MNDSKQNNNNNSKNELLSDLARAEVEVLWRDLQLDPPQISSKWFYDTLGSVLFHAITKLPEYRPTRCEMEILSDPSLALWSKLPEEAAVVELGSGSEDKILKLLERRQDVRAYHPIDVSESALEDACRSIQLMHPKLDVSPLCGDFCDTEQLEQLLEKVSASAKSLLLFFPGSTIGNFDLGFAKELLAASARGCQMGAKMLLGVDLVREPRDLERAYDDSVGLTAAFNKNLLAHLRRRFDLSVDLSQWRHQALYNGEQKRIEMWLRAKSPQEIGLQGKTFSFAEGEGIRTECSHKFDRERMEDLLDRSGWDIQSWVTDPSESFAEVLLQRVA